MMPPSLQRKRFEVLDAWRGLCAVIIVCGHFQIPMWQSIHFGSVIENNYVFVDFFFVLSGFVIARNYWEKLKTKTELRRFMIVRWGRVYPLHAFMLILFIGLEYARSSVEGDAMFSSQVKSFESLIENIFLVHSMGIYPDLSWNIPSWSISVEFFSYLTFAVVLLVAGPKRLPAISIIIALAAPIILWVFVREYEAAYTYDYGFIRCLGGFFAGVLVCKLYEKSQVKLDQIGMGHATFLEILMLVSVILFTMNVDNTYLSYAAPYLFSVCVLVFAIEGGYVSTALKTKPFLFLGALSYSLYMTHAFVQRVMVNGIDIIEKYVGLDWVKQGVNKEDPTDIARYFDVGIPMAVLLTGIMLVAVVIFSTITYNLIEKPLYSWIKSRVR
ncbi:MAG: acyltransferase [Alphaproteobacteria bacterium]|nr:acyltransferase [Alphaproteobacteria bacterium]